MKKIVFTIILIATFSSSYCQYYGGFSFSRSRLSNGHFFSVKNRMSSPELIIGANLNKKWSIETACRWINRIDDYNYDMGGSSGGGYLFASGKHIKTELKYLNIPLLFNFQNKNDERIFYFKFGPQLSYLRAATCTETPTGGMVGLPGGLYGNYLSGNQPGGSFDQDEKTQAFDYTFRDKFNYFHLELAFKAGMIIKLSRAFGLDIGYSYEHSLANVENTKATDNLGRKLNRYTDYSERTEGPRPTLIPRRGYLYFSINYYFNYDKSIF